MPEYTILNQQSKQTSDVLKFAEYHSRLRLYAQFLSDSINIYLFIYYKNRKRSKQKQSSSSARNIRLKRDNENDNSTVER